MSSAVCMKIIITNLSQIMLVNEAIVNGRNSF